MASGGARAVSGPAPSASSARSDRRGLTFRVLPASGYHGPVPEFPLEPPQARPDRDGVASASQTDALERAEARLWVFAWSLPQAVAWASEPWRVYSVAQWVRVAALCEMPGASAADRTAMLRLQEEIGLTGPGLARNGWVIGDPEVPDAAVESAKRRPGSSRSRMKVISGGRDG